MRWELAALEILARNPTVPGVALKDCITGLKCLQKQHIIALDEIALLQERITFLETEIERLRPKWIGIPNEEEK